MARLTRTEQLSRLKERYNELIKPVFVIAEQVGDNIEAILILNNGNKHKQTFKENELESFITENQDCNIIMNDRLITMKESTQRDIITDLDNDSLHAIVNNTADAKELEKLFLVRVLDSI